MKRLKFIRQTGRWRVAQHSTRAEIIWKRGLPLGWELMLRETGCTGCGVCGKDETQTGKCAEAGATSV